MDQKLKKRWVEALRSGDYNQVQYHLKADGGYCCLGVLCEIDERVTYDPDIVLNEDCPPGGFIFDKHPMYFEQLSEQYRDDVGLTDPQETTLIRMNDVGVPFADIAQHIEDHM